jgi:4-hydroxy-3-polyprenylbenzoate decarboxylase
MTEKTRGYLDLHEHLAALDRQGLLLTIDRAVDKDAELHPLVRWQFVGGIEEHERKAFLFTNVVDGRGRKYAFPVVVGALAANREIYCLGMRCTGGRSPGAVGPCYCPSAAAESGDDGRLPGDCHRRRRAAGRGTRPRQPADSDFHAGIRQRADAHLRPTSSRAIRRPACRTTARIAPALKASDRLVVRMATRVGGAGGYRHYVKHQQRGDKTMPCAIVLGGPPCVAFVAPQKLPIDVDEIGVAGRPGGRTNQHRARAHRRFNGARGSRDRD